MYIFRMSMLRVRCVVPISSWRMWSRGWSQSTTSLDTYTKVCAQRYNGRRDTVSITITTSTFQHMGWPTMAQPHLWTLQPALTPRRARFLGILPLCLTCRERSRDGLDELLNKETSILIAQMLLSLFSTSDGMNRSLSISLAMKRIPLP